MFFLKKARSVSPGFLFFLLGSFEPRHPERSRRASGNFAITGEVMPSRVSQQRAVAKISRVFLPLSLNTSVLHLSQEERNTSCRASAASRDISRNSSLSRTPVFNSFALGKQECVMSSERSEWRHLKRSLHSARPAIAGLSPVGMTREKNITRFQHRFF